MNKGNPNPSPTTRFTSENQPKNKGRKKSKLNKFIVDSGISSDDISKVIKDIVFEKTVAELKEISADERQPMLIRLFIKALVDDYKKGAIYNIEKMLDRAIGKPIQRQEHDISGDITIKVDYN